MSFQIGETIELGWNGAKQLGNEDLAYSTVRVEAFGVDWVVVRSEDGQPWVARSWDGNLTLRSELFQ